MAWSSGIVELFLSLIVVIGLKIYDNIMNRNVQVPGAQSVPGSEQKYKDETRLGGQPESGQGVDNTAVASGAHQPPAQEQQRYNPVPPAEVRCEKDKLYSTFYLIFTHHVVAISLFTTQAGPSVLCWLHFIAFLAWVFGNLKPMEVVAKYSHLAMYSIDLLLIWWGVFYWL